MPGNPHRTLQQTWWSQQAGAPRHWRTLVHLEAAATRVCDFQFAVLPVLLRTADYGRQVLANGFLRRSADDVDRLVALQQARQAVLTRQRGPSVHAIVDEHALSRLRGANPLSRRQLLHLLEVSERPDVTFQVIPHSVGMHAGMHGAFTVMEFARATDIVFTEQLVSAAYYQTERDLIIYRNILASLRTDALSPRGTRDFLLDMLNSP
jgi:hypothetical protein